MHICTTYEQTWEMCTSSVDGRAKGEGCVSISRCPEFIFTLILAYNAIGQVASTVDPVTTLRLVLDYHIQETHTFCLKTLPKVTPFCPKSISHIGPPHSAWFL